MSELVAQTRRRGIRVARSVAGRFGVDVTRPRFHEDHPIDIRRILLAGGDQATPLNVIQIGANDGKTDDPIWDLVHSMPVRLCALEPQPTAFAQLVANYEGRPDTVLIQSGVGLVDGTMTLWGFTDVGDHRDLLASFDRALIDRHVLRLPELRDRVMSIEVPMMTFASVLEKAGFGEVDLLQVDAEGHDLDIIEMCLAAGCRPRVIAFEWTHLGQERMWRARSALAAAGYCWAIDRGDVVAARDAQRLVLIEMTP